MVYSPIPPLYFCLESMIGENINIRARCKPWIPRDSPAEDLIRLTERIQTLAPELRLDEASFRRASPLTHEEKDVKGAGP